MGWDAIHLSIGNPTHLNGTSGSIPTFSSSTGRPAFDFNGFQPFRRVFVDLCVTIGGPSEVEQSRAVEKVAKVLQVTNRFKFEILFCCHCFVSTSAVKSVQSQRGLGEWKFVLCKALLTAVVNLCKSASNPCQRITPMGGA